MNIQEITVFLTIADTLSISKAAKLLYLSQPAISQCLKSLEKDLDTVLIDRKKGNRTVTLTPKGKEFISFANRWTALYRDTMQFKTTTAVPTLTLACSDSMNLYIFNELYNQILRNKLPINLNVKSHHYLLIYPMLEKAEIDIGLVTSQINYPNISIQPIISEPMYLVCSNNSPFKTSSIHAEELDPSREIYIDWGTEYRQWHDYWLNSRVAPFIHINSPSNVFNFIQNPNTWAIVPASMVKDFKRMLDFEVHSILKPPPNRICYKLINKINKQRNNNSLEIFEEQLKKFLKTIEWRL